MKRQTSYRQKLIELAKIYKLDKIFESGSRLTTYEIELVLLKNKVPLPTRRSYLAHLIINEIINPIYQSINKTRLDIVESINKFFRRIINNTKRNYFDLIDDVLNKADCIMTDVFTSMNDKDDKEKILNRFQINSSVMSKTKDSTVFMHCLPAKINSEVTSDVIKGKKSIVIKQAENRLHAQRGILKWLSI